MRNAAGANPPLQRAEERFSLPGTAGFCCGFREQRDPQQSMPTPLSKSDLASAPAERADENWRLFVALPLPENAVAALAEVQDRLRRAVPDRAVRWTRPTQMHLTLQFLGNVAANRVPDLEAALRQAVNAGAASSLSLHLDGLGAFPNPRRPRVLWAGLSGDLETLAALQARVAAACAPFLAEARSGQANFQPHLTLARIKARAGRAARDAGAGLARCPAPAPTAWTAEELHLLRSVLLPDGAVHSLLAKLPLAPDVSSAA